jgi:hypothetical protein
VTAQRQDVRASFRGDWGWSSISSLISSQNQRDVGMRMRAISPVIKLIGMAAIIRYTVTASKLATRQYIINSRTIGSDFWTKAQISRIRGIITVNRTAKR